MADDDLHQRIETLAHEEHELRKAHSAGNMSDAERARLAEIEVALDRTWDLLRQRAARREAGQNPDDAHERAGGVVEGYLQ